MKKLMTLMLGFALAFTTAAVTFSQDTPPKKSAKKAKTKTSGKKKEDAKKNPQKHGGG